MTDALEAINEAAAGHSTPEAALTQIREALGELIAMAAIGHRQKVEQDEENRRGGMSVNPRAAHR